MHIKLEKPLLISNVDIDISTINGGEIANKKGFLKLNMHISLEGYPDFVLNPRSSISQGVKFGIYWVVSRINNFVMDKAHTDVVCHLSSIAHRSYGKLWMMFSPFMIKSPTLIDLISLPSLLSLIVCWQK